MTGLDRSQGRFSSTACIFFFTLLSFQLPRSFAVEGEGAASELGRLQVMYGDSKSSVHHAEQQLV